MLRTAWLAAVLLGALAGAARAQDPELDRDDTRRIQRAEEALSDEVEPAVHRGWSPTLGGQLRAGAGAVDGDTINPGRGALSLVEGELRAGVDRGRMSGEAELALGHRQTFGASLSESHADGTVRGGLQLSGAFRLGGELGLGLVSRPGWPDPFQAMAPTDRYGHWDREAAAELVARPGRNDRGRLRYDHELAVYRHDPSFDPIYDPLHLAPWDQETHRIDLAWRHRWRGVRVGLGAEVARRQFFFRFAGDARSGVTHAGPAGAPPNPLLQLRWAKPRADLEVPLGERRRIVAGAGYELELQVDTRQGYLSYVGHHPALSVTWALPRNVASVVGRVDLFWRRYGPNSYAGGGTHSPLTWGDRRADRLGTASLALRIPVLVRWTAIASGSLAVRRTNYAETIRWSYTTWEAWAGAEHTFGDPARKVF